MSREDPMLSHVMLSKSIRLFLRLWMPTLLVLITAGCSLAPTYQRPLPPVPQSQGKDVVTTKLIGSEAWLSEEETSLLAELAPSGELRRQVEMALSFNRDWRIAGLRVKEAQSLYAVNRADRLPTLTAGVEQNRQHFDNAAFDERYGQKLSAATLGISGFELDFFGRVRSLSDAARHDYLATAYGQQAARSALVVEVARAYLSEQLTAALENDARRVNDAQQALLQMAENEQLQGASSLDEVALERTKALRSHLQLEATVAEHSRAVQGLLLLTGYSAPLRGGEPETTELTGAVSNTPAGLADMPSQRLLQRFDVRQSEELLKAANANIGAARAAFFPSIRLSTGMGVASEGLSKLFEGGGGTWSFSPQLTLPLFDFGRNQSNLDLAEVRKQIAIAQYEKTIQIAFREVADVLTQRRQALDRMRSESELRTVAQENAHRLSAALEVGGIDRRMLAGASIRIAKADMAWHRSRHELLLNRLDIYRVLRGTDAAAPQSVSSIGASL